MYVLGSLSRSNVHLIYYQTSPLVWFFYHSSRRVSTPHTAVRCGLFEGASGSASCGFYRSRRRAPRSGMPTTKGRSSRFAQLAISAQRLTTSSTHSQRVSLLRCVNTKAPTSAWRSACISTAFLGDPLVVGHQKPGALADLG